jgi:hypothetical protein
MAHGSKEKAPAGYGEPGLLEEIVTCITINKSHVLFAASTDRFRCSCWITNPARAAASGGRVAELGERLNTTERADALAVGNENASFASAPVWGD